MRVATHRAPNFVLTEHEFELPVDHSSGRSPKLTVFAREVVTPGHEQGDLPWLVFFQGGPGVEAPRPLKLVEKTWLERALEDYRVLLLDQRGTGRSTPVGDLAGMGAEAQAEYLTHFRADSIVRDAELIRSELGVERWSVLGQSFGGFCAVNYLSQAPEGLAAALITGGLPPLERHPDEVYRATYERMLAKNNAFYDRYPEDRDRALAIVEHIEAENVRLPAGDRLTARRFRQLGHLLGMSDGFERLHYILELPFGSPAFLRDVEASYTFARNPLYAVIHEACYAPGVATRWSAERVFPDELRDDPTFLTGEHIYPWMLVELRNFVFFGRSISYQPFPAWLDPRSAASEWCCRARRQRAPELSRPAAHRSLSGDPPGSPEPPPLVRGAFGTTDRTLMVEFAQQVVSGLASGSIYASLALAIVIIYRSTGVVNFAQGEIATFTTFIAWTLIDHGLGYWAAFALTLLIAFVGGVALERIIVRPVEGSPVVTAVILTIGLFILFGGLSNWIWKAQVRSFPPNRPFPTSTWDIGGVAVSKQDLGILAVTLALVALLYLLFQRTKLGLTLRASALSPSSSRLVGIRVGWMLGIGWGLAAAIGAVAGLFTAAAVPPLDPNMMRPILIYAFAAAVLGGLESPIGAVIGGLSLGVGLNLIATYDEHVHLDLDQLRLPIALLVILIVLLVRPAGLLGRTVARRV